MKYFLVSMRWPIQSHASHVVMIRWFSWLKNEDEMKKKMLFLRDQVKVHHFIYRGWTFESRKIRKQQTFKEHKFGCCYTYIGLYYNGGWFFSFFFQIKFQLNSADGFSVFELEMFGPSVHQLVTRWFEWHVPVYVFLINIFILRVN